MVKTYFASIGFREVEVVLLTDHLADKEAALEEKDKELERLGADLSVNSTMFARQCDMARDAERELLASQRQITALKVEAQELHDKYGKLWDENKRLREKQ